LNKRFIGAIVFLILYLASIPLLPPTIMRNDLILSLYIVLGFIAVVLALIGAKSGKSNWG